jgi:hypothetical protein
MASNLGRRRVLLLEFNEITRTIIDPLIAQGKLPTFQRLLREGAWAAPESVDQPPHLDPWVTWVTVHTGVPREVHGATVLEQEDTTIQAKRSWDYVVAAGKSVGVFGSISAYPPRPVPGFMVPGPFAPTTATFPSYVEPVHELNRKYTQVHNKVDREDSPLAMAGQALSLFGLGLKASTCARAALQLARERIEPHTHWKRVCLQPLINYDFFEHLYRRYQPDFATWHTNHAAHYMHHYWRAWDDSKFLTQSSEEEKNKYGDAIPYGYEICDTLLAKFLELAGEDTIVVVASSMGQQPFVKDMFPEGKVGIRFKDVRQVLAIVGAEVTDVAPMMAPQWNVRIPDAANRTRTRELLERAHMTGGNRTAAISVAETGDILTVTPYGLSPWKGEVRYFFPDAPNAKAEGYLIDELFAYDRPTAKQGMHHPRGLLAFWGKGIKPGLTIEGTTNLDILPTLLTLLDVPVPATMTGRVLSEAWGEPSARPVDRQASAPA